MLDIDTSSPALVTGATGYVAGILVKRLLEAGVTVHAAVRDPSKQEKVKYLDEIAAASPGKIEYFKADLMDTGSYAEAMEGCSIVFHTASPFKLNVKDPQKELVEPAKLGTRNVLNEATKTPSVKRVVVTSSTAAISGDNIDLQKTQNGRFTEEDWNTTSSLTHNPYSYSKTEAEKEAWKIAEGQNQWELVTINPSAVMGPGLDAHAASESMDIIRQMGDGSMRIGAPNIGIGVVDVRDVAEAHLAAAYSPNARGRYLIAGHNSSFADLAFTLLPEYGKQYPIPRRIIPKWIIWLVAPLASASMTRKIISNNAGYPWIGDNSKSVRELGMSYRPLEETMNDFFQQMIDNNVFDSN
ncbi:MAG: NAD-dependent epimerase/dehydratase family protein [Pseudomonadales bacterium]|nr:MAG: NAD-dependent epimerase/dehydratase family protein [Pseudomonadales bacterium]